MKYNQNQLNEVLKDSRFQNIGTLPSQCKGYDWDTLYIRPFEVTDFKLVSKAAILGEMSHMVRAVDLAITQDANDLTIGDFYYVMMWLRIHSLPKTPLIVDWECGEQVLRHKESNEVIFNDETFKHPENMDDYVLEPCGTQNTESLHMVNVEIMSLDENPDNIIIPDGFDFPRARHLEGITAALKDPETAMLIPSVQWVAGNTVADKFNSIMGAGAAGMDMLDTGHALNEKYEHGVKEVTTISCRRCRHQEQYVINMNPMSFFP